MNNLSESPAGRRTSSRKKPHRTSNSPEAVKGRNKLAVTSLFVKKLLSDPLLYEIWNNEKPGNIRSPFNYACKINYEKSSAGRPSLLNVITPEKGFHLPSFWAGIFEEGIVFQINPLKRKLNDPDISQGENLKYTFRGLISYYNPLEPEEKPYALIPVNQRALLFKSENPMDKTITLNSSEKVIAAKYSRFILYLAVILLDAEENVTGYSRTVAGAGKLN